jgi:hypothetical protein
VGNDACPQCREPVQRMITHGGRIRDLEVHSHPDGDHVIEWADQHIRARVLTGLELPAQGPPAFRRHECPPAPPPGPNCAECGHEMPREIATLLRWTEHPACDPDFTAQLNEERLARRPPPRGLPAGGPTTRANEPKPPASNGRPRSRTAWTRSGERRRNVISLYDAGTATRPVTAPTCPHL